MDFGATRSLYKRARTPGNPERRKTPHRGARSPSRGLHLVCTPLPHHCPTMAEDDDNAGKRLRVETLYGTVRGLDLHPWGQPDRSHPSVP